MKRKLLIGLFTFGTIFGFGSGIASMACWHGRHAEARRVAFERHVADVCVEAAQRAQPHAAPPVDPYYEPYQPPPRHRYRHGHHR